MPASTRRRVQKHRDAMRAAGFRQVQIWVPDTRAPGFAEEYRRQGAAAAAADRGDKEMWDILDAALADALRETNE